MAFDDPVVIKGLKTKMQRIVNQYPFNDNNIALKVKKQLKDILSIDLSKTDKEALINNEYSHCNASKVTLWYTHTQKGRTTPLGYFISSMEVTSIKVNAIWQCIKLLLQNGAILASPTNIAQQFHKNMIQRSIDPHIIASRLHFFLKSINNNSQEQQTHNLSIITHDLSEPPLSTHIYLIPSPSTLAVYLEQQYEILHIKDNNNVSFSEKQKECIVNNLIKTDLRNKDSFIKYLFAFRIFSEQLRARKARQLCRILSDIQFEYNRDVIDLLLTFVYDGMCYLKYSTRDKELEFVNHSLEMYGYLSPKWKTWIYTHYIMKVPKQELAKLHTFAYLCYL